VFGVAAAVVTWVVLTIVALLSAALVAVSLRWGPTPRPLATLLGVAWVCVLTWIVLGAGSRRSWRLQAAAAGGLALLALVAVLLSQASAYTPPIVDATGRVAPGSIATLERVTLGGAPQWISIRGTSTHQPVLLWLAGGPGGSEVATARHHLAALEAHFVVVTWEQPGAGKSYHAVRHTTLTPERYVSDGVELVEYLRQRFGQEKVYLAGESWGSALGIWMVQRRPDLFYAFAGTGQMVSFLETDRADYAFALRLARERGDTKKLANLAVQGPPPYYGKGVALKQARYLLDGFAYMNADPNIAQDQFNTISDLLSPEYGLYDKLNWLRGTLDSLDAVYPQLWTVDFRIIAPRLEVPVYFLIGRHDINAPPALAEDYFRLLDAPSKEWIWFEHSGHNPWVSEAERFCDVLVEKFLGSR
jgi:pimeloyl-ACP methyl ester carboxylesterase